jgi:hypothetical protein
MGWFTGRRYTTTEEELLKFYAATLERTYPSPAIARETATSVLNRAIATSKQQGTYGLPINMGDIILGRSPATTDLASGIAVAVRQALPQKRKDGVTDEDIRSWWNAPDVSRRMAVLMEEGDRMEVYLAFLTNTEHGKDPTTLLWQHFPRYGNPDDQSQSTGEDRPLPLELKKRINRYTDSRAASSMDALQDELYSESSMNAHIRRQIRNGAL